MNEKLAIIGTGMMGSAILSGILRQNSFKPEDILIYDLDEKKIQALHEKTGVVCAESNIAAAKDADYILIAVKPQYLNEVVDDLHGRLNSQALVISIVVGVQIQELQEKLEHKRILRVMPNTPAAIGEGVSGWYASEFAEPEQVEKAAEILSGIGTTIRVRKESDLDIVTAVSGSGPAYVFLFMEAMIDCAVRLGLPRPDATELVIQTVKGSALYLAERNTHPAILKSEVTSPGGTTAEALYAMEKSGLRSSIADGMQACYDKTIELGACAKMTKRTK